VAIKDRFSEHVKKAISISSIISYHVSDKTYSVLTPAVTFYQKFLPGSLSQIKSEFLLGKNRWTQINKVNNFTSQSPSSVNSTTSPSMKCEGQIRLPDTAINAYVKCSVAFYPNMKILLKIFTTLSVTTATTERIFLVLKLVKTHPM
jgi:hypothetical protein